MSLVGDALRKARREAAARDAERRGMLFSARISEAPARSNLGLGLVLGAVIAVVATVAGGSVAWWLLRGGADAPGRAQAEPLGPAAVEPGAPVAGTESTEGAGTAAGPVPERAEPSPSEPDGAAPTAGAHSQAGPVEAVAAPADPSAEAPTRQSTASESTTDDATPVGFVGVEDGNEIYILEADVGGGRVLSLDYIVFRADDPYAEINGVEIHLGGVVSGFRVKAVERDRVVLSDGRRTVVLRTP
ncbi:MAG TPA: hypothetical protein VLT32_00050 [Candidatus Sulfomarinibacteraceae bacterium]|nr:hypothetical protein [Candidatus Sulfomarinibacteraceae bacterium]